MSPLFRSARPAIADSRVVLPTPLRPSTARISPAGSSNEISVMTWVAPQPALTRSQTSEVIPLLLPVSSMVAMPQIDIPNKAVRCDVLRRSFDNDLPRHQDADPLRKSRNQFHIVLDEQHRDIR